MNKAIFKLFLLTGLGLLAISCSSFYNLEKIMERRMVVIYQLADKNYPPEDSSIREQVAEPLDFPEIERSKWHAVLGNLHYKRQNLWSDTTGPIFAEEELPRLIHAVSEAQPQMKAGHRLVLVSRYDPNRSVLSRMHVNTALIWVDESGMNLVFGVIHEEMPVDDYHSDEDWSQISPISLKESFRDLEVLPADFFQFKEINKKEHRTWAVVSLEKLASLTYESRTEEPEADNSDDTSESAKKQSTRTPAQRLRDLQKALDDGLITEDEYQQQRERILKEF